MTSIHRKYWLDKSKKKEEQKNESKTQKEKPDIFIEFENEHTCISDI